MSSDIQVNTAALRTAAGSILDINNQIDSDFEAAADSINKLYNVWSGAAALAGRAGFKSIKKSYYSDSSTSRRAVLKEYAVFLRKTAAVGYEAVEKSNIRLADMFK